MMIHQRVPQLMNVCQRSIAAVLAFLIVLPNSTFGQQAPATVPPPKLRILILEGKDAVNSIPDRAAAFPVVEIRDENFLPVEGAEVTFELPATGPGGVFPGDKKTFTARTNVQGQVRAPYLMNASPGAFTIRVRAAIGARSEEATIAQTHSMRTSTDLTARTGQRKRWYKDWRIWAVAGGAAAVGIILATRGGSSATTGDGRLVINPGSPSLGAPR